MILLQKASHQTSMYVPVDFRLKIRVCDARGWHSTNAP